MISYVRNTSNWEQWQIEYRFGIILIIPPDEVLQQIEPLRERYDYRSFVSNPTHVTVSDPLCCEMTPELFREIQFNLSRVSSFMLYYDKPSASKEHPGVAYPIRPREPIDELKRILHSSSAFSNEAYWLRNVPPHITIAEFISIEDSLKLCDEILDSAPSGSFLCDRLELIVPDENFRFKRSGTFLLKQ
ncbi:MAG: 2'-5' RNA ligase family protein [Calditrichaeota bacterium]|nr:2'-5' RNA ligase family protein [Calditrichota bacterium]